MNGDLIVNVSLSGLIATARSQLASAVPWARPEANDNHHLNSQGYVLKRDEMQLAYSQETSTSALTVYGNHMGKEACHGV